MVSLTVNIQGEEFVLNPSRLAVTSPPWVQGDVR
jgi:hypothetical protein